MRSIFAPRDLYPTEKAEIAGLHERQRIPLPEYNTGWYAPNPSLIRVVRFLMHLLVGAVCIVEAALGCSVAGWYNMQEKAIEPAWGSMIACVVFGFATPVVLLGHMLVLPRMPGVRRPLSAMNMLVHVKMELVILISLSIIWFCSALAQAADLRGDEYCLWDGYYHYPKPADFQHVCQLINVSVSLGYTAFGVVFGETVIVLFFTVYIYLLLDQEVLSEPANDMGGRAYRARTVALSTRSERDFLDRQALLRRETGPDIPNSRRVAGAVVPEGTPSVAQPQVAPSGEIRQVFGTQGEPLLRHGHPVDEEHAQVPGRVVHIAESDDEDDASERYYGY